MSFHANRAKVGPIIVAQGPRLKIPGIGLSLWSQEGTGGKWGYNSRCSKSFRFCLIYIMPLPF